MNRGLQRVRVYDRVRKNASALSRREGDRFRADQMDRQEAAGVRYTLQGGRSETKGTEDCNVGRSPASNRFSLWQAYALGRGPRA